MLWWGLTGPYFVLRRLQRIRKLLGNDKISDTLNVETEQKQKEEVASEERTLPALDISRWVWSDSPPPLPPPVTSHIAII